MNWYKKATRMFETFGLPDKIVNSFVQHYNNWMRQYDNPIMRQRIFEVDKQIYLGAANISSALQPIFEKHGQPQGMNGKIPNRINFIILHPSHKYGKNKSSFFTVLPQDNSFVIVKIESNINNVKLDHEFSNTIKHELQHFLRSLYEGRAAPSYAYIKDYEGLDYYGDPWEIQTFALRFAADAIDLVKSTYLARIEGMPPERAQEILEKVKGNKSKLATIAIKQTKRHFLSMEDLENKMPEELLKKYYSATVANFNKLFDDMIGKYEQLV